MAKASVDAGLSERTAKRFAGQLDSVLADTKDTSAEPNLRAMFSDFMRWASALNDAVLHFVRSRGLSAVAYPPLTPSHDVVADLAVQLPQGCLIIDWVVFWVVLNAVFSQHRRII